MGCATGADNEQQQNDDRRLLPCSWLVLLLLLGIPWACCVCVSSSMPVISSTQRKPLLIALAIVFLFVIFQTVPIQLQRTTTTTTQSNAWSSDTLSVAPPTTTTAAWHNKTRANAAFVILTRNSELDALRKTMQQLEARFNSKFNYPYVFLNDEEFTDEFRELTTSMTSAETHYGMSVWWWKQAYGLGLTECIRHHSQGALELSFMDRCWKSWSGSSTNGWTRCAIWW